MRVWSCLTVTMPLQLVPRMWRAQIAMAIHLLGLCLVQVPFRRQHFQIVRLATVIAHLRELDEVG